MKIISKETSQRVCDHMNNDHIDSVQISYSLWKDIKI